MTRFDAVKAEVRAQIERGATPSITQAVRTVDERTEVLVVAATRPMRTEVIIVAAEGWDDVVTKAMAAHPDPDDSHAWSITIDESTDEVAKAGAASRGLIAYTIKRKLVKIR